MEKTNLIDEVDDTIRAICKKIQTDDVFPGTYAETINSLAALVEARKQLEAGKSINCKVAKIPNDF